METLELKTNIFQLIDKMEDTDILNAINTLLEKQVTKPSTQDFWNDLPQNIRNAIKTSANEADAGKRIAHNQVMQGLKAKYALK